ncbi:MAG: hypothetical protein HRT68_02330 [Flavobacteriaceae bacterium]|nr:hypothetical protein [Flavobacteriaceae bacterium]
MDKILKYPLIPQNVYERYRALKRIPVYDSTTMQKLIFHIAADAQKEDNTEVSKLAKLILFDLKNYLNHPAVYKEKYTASALENRLALLGDGRTSDDLPKINPNISSLLSQHEIEKIPAEIQLKICSNFREKGDLIFYDPRQDSSYKVSIKSLIPENKEINFGAFDFTSLVTGILDDKFLALGERRSKIKVSHNDVDYEIGRGSKAQLSQLFHYLNEIDKLEEFFERWEIAFKGVFKEDVLIYIKNYKRLQLYLLSNEDFIRCISDSLRSYWNDMSSSAINRWEGNSIRMSRDVIIKYCTYSIDKEFNGFFNESKLVAILNEVQVEKTNKLISVNFE